MAQLSEEELKQKLSRAVYVIGARRYAEVAKDTAYIHEDGTRYESVEDYLLDLFRQYAEEREAESEKGFQHIDQMISDYIRNTWPGGDVLRASEAKPINWEPLVRQIRDYATGRFGHGKRLQSMIDKADTIIDRLTSPLPNTEKENS